MNRQYLTDREKILWTLYIFMALNLTVSLVFGLALYLTRETGGLLAIKIVTVHFIVRLIFAIPVYWLIFWKYRHKTLRTRLLLHLITLLFFTLLSSEGTFLILNLPYMGGIKHLQWPTLFWEYFNIMFIYLFLFSGVHIFENYVQMKEHQEKEKELMKLAHQSEMNALKAQIQPHFLFNTLNSISASVPPHLEHTRILIARLADTFRFALNANANESITLREELAFIKAYLEL